MEVPLDEYTVMYGDYVKTFRDRDAAVKKLEEILRTTGEHAHYTFEGVERDPSLGYRMIGRNPRLRFKMNLPPGDWDKVRSELRARLRASLPPRGRRGGYIIVPVWSLALPGAAETLDEYILRYTSNREDAKRVIDEITGRYAGFYREILGYVERETGVKPGEITHLAVRAISRDIVAIEFRTVRLGRDRFRMAASRAAYRDGVFALKLPREEAERLERMLGTQPA